MKVFLGMLGLGYWLLRKKKAGTDRDNRYFPVQSSSERAAGHPIVGVS
jgi:hypothetical protein